MIHAMIGVIAQTGLFKNRLEGMIVDITDRVFIEKSEIQKEKLKILGSITTEVAHEIRNPLVSIGGFYLSLKERMIWSSLFLFLKKILHFDMSFLHYCKFGMIPAFVFFNNSIY